MGEGAKEATMDFEEDVDVEDDDGVDDDVGGHYFLPRNVSRRWNEIGRTETIPRPHIIGREKDDFHHWKLTSAEGSSGRKTTATAAPRRPPIPLPNHATASSGTLDRQTNVDDGCTHYYASAATLRRDRRKAEEEAPRTPADIYRNYLKRVEASSESDIFYSRTMSSYFYESSRKNSARRRLEGLVGAIGFVGIVLSIASLLAYLAVQAPNLRKAIGPFYATEHHEGSFKAIDEGDESEMRRLEPQTSNVIYAMELTCCIFISLMMIMANSLLIHAARRKSAAFLLPWLIFHCFLITAILVSAVLILVYVEPAPFKALGLVPLVAAMLLTLCWIKVFKLHQTIKRAFNLGRRFRHPNFASLENPHATCREPKTPEPDIYY